MPQLLDHRGNPITIKTHDLTTRAGTASAYTARKKTMGFFAQMLTGGAAVSTTMNADPEIKARVPVLNHAWVYAIAQIAAASLSQAPLSMMRETDQATDRRSAIMVKQGRIKNATMFTPGRGRNRAWLTHLGKAKDRLTNRHFKAIEPDYGHPLHNILNRPNEYMSGTSLVEWTILNLLGTPEGAAFWVARHEDGTLWTRGDDITKVAEIIPINPDRMQPEWSMRPRTIIRWRYSVPSYDPFGWERDIEYLDPDNVIHFRLTHPRSVINGLSPVTPAMTEIITDLMAQFANLATIDGVIEPGLILETMNAQALQPDQKQEIIDAIIARHRGAGKSGKPLILDGGLKLADQPNGLDPDRFQGIRDNSRDSLLAAGRTPRSALSSDAAANYATALISDRGYWSKTLMPLMLLIETEINTTLLWNEPDTTVATFDTSGIEALVDFIDDKVNQAVKLANQLRMPPRLALETVGIETDRYIGDDRVLIPMNQVPIEYNLDPDNLPNRNPQPIAPDDPEDPDDPESEDPEDPEDPDEPVQQTAPKPIYATRTKAARLRMADTYTRWQEQHYNAISDRYRAHIDSLRRKTLARFDALHPDATKGITLDLTDTDRAAIHTASTILEAAETSTPKPTTSKGCGCASTDDLSTLRDALAVLRQIGPEEIDRILFDLDEAGADLIARFDPVYQQMLQGAVAFTETELGGIRIFDLADNSQVDRFMESKRVLVRGVSQTVQDRVRSTILKGIENSDTVQEIRQSISRRFNQLSKPSRALTIARTETAQVYSGARDIIHRTEGITEHEWLTAGDEAVRDDHTLLGSIGPVPIGTNFLAMIGRSGTLKYPSEIGGPADQVINCRCIAIATN